MITVQEQRCAVLWFLARPTTRDAQKMISLASFGGFHMGEWMLICVIWTSTFSSFHYFPWQRSLSSAHWILILLGTHKPWQRAIFITWIYHISYTLIHRTVPQHLIGPPDEERAIARCGSYIMLGTRISSVHRSSTVHFWYLRKQQRIPDIPNGSWLVDDVRN